MNTLLYASELQNLKKRFNSSNFIITDLLKRTLCFTSANLSNYMLKIPYKQHKKILKNILLNQQKSILEGKYENILNSITIENKTELVDQILRNKPCIIYSFHFGSMQLINHFLAYNNIKYYFIASKTTLDEHLGDYLEMAEFQRTRYSVAELNYIEADEPNSALKMIRAIKNGYHLLIYVDGNVGSGANKNENLNICKLNFFNRPIYVRQGAATLSYIMGVPLLGAISYRKNNEQIFLRFIAPIYPTLETPRLLESKRLMQIIYDEFSNLLKKYPSQWECWIYLNDCINTKAFEYNLLPTKKKIKESYYFNENDYGLFTIKEKFYILCKRNYNSFELKEDIYNILNVSDNFEIKSNSLKLCELKQLINYQILKNNR